jgi:hypothetical protein
MHNTFYTRFANNEEKAAETPLFKCDALQYSCLDDAVTAEWLC